MTTTEQRLAALEAEVAELRRAVVFTTALGDEIEARGYRAGRESILGGAEGSALRAAWDAGRASAHEDTAPRPAARRLRHRHAVQGGGR